MRDDEEREAIPPVVPAACWRHTRARAHVSSRSISLGGMGGTDGGELATNQEAYKSYKALKLRVKMFPSLAISILNHLNNSEFNRHL